MVHEVLRSIPSRAVFLAHVKNLVRHSLGQGTSGLFVSLKTRTKLGELILVAVENCRLIRVSRLCK